MMLVHDLLDKWKSNLDAPIITPTGMDPSFGIERGRKVALMRCIQELEQALEFEEQRNVRRS